MLATGWQTQQVVCGEDTPNPKKVGLTQGLLKTCTRVQSGVHKKTPRGTGRRERAPRLGKRVLSPHSRRQGSGYAGLIFPAHAPGPLPRSLGSLAGSRAQLSPGKRSASPGARSLAHRPGSLPRCRSGGGRRGPPRPRRRRPRFRPAATLDRRRSRSPAVPAAHPAPLQFQEDKKRGQGGEGGGDANDQGRSPGQPPAKPTRLHAVARRLTLQRDSKRG